MSASCAWCLHAWHADRCQFPGSDWCRTERRNEDMAHAINESYRAAEEKS